MGRKEGRNKRGKGGYRYTPYAFRTRPSSCPPHVVLNGALKDSNETQQQKKHQQRQQGISHLPVLAVLETAAAQTLKRVHNSW